MTDFALLRDQITALRKVLYLNWGWDGPSPEPVLQAIEQQLRLENTEGPTSPPVLAGRRDIFDQARQAFASFLGVTPQEIALTENTTEGINLIVSGFPWRPGDEILTNDMEHPSVLLPAYLAQRRFGAVTKVVHLDASANAATLLAAFAQAVTPRTRLVFVSHAQYSTGLLLPVRELADLAHRSNAQILVDGAQTMGQLPLDLRRLDVDYYAFPGHKWLCGPDGTGGLFVRRELISSITSPKVGHRGVPTFDFSGHFEENPTAIEKFELTTRNGALWKGLVVTVRWMEEAGLSAVRQRILDLSGLLKEKLERLPGLQLLSPRDPSLSVGLVTFRLPGLAAEAVQDHLWQRGRIVARRINELGAVRLSVHAFNTEGEIDTVVETLESIARQVAPTPAVGKPEAH
ncbi:MAG: aminotransferase class V-fold PLP-dependent enzyme [Chloroflexi bacterium]|nr:aminotransferase class V-fold PLP-dependent enzyme [Chloroflexota bacterium]